MSVHSCVLCYLSEIYFPRIYPECTAGAQALMEPAEMLLCNFRGSLEQCFGVVLGTLNAECFTGIQQMVVKEREWE